MIPGTFSNAIDDDTFAKIVAVLRIAVPYTGMIVSTRESQKSRERVLDLGISQISGGSLHPVSAVIPKKSSGRYNTIRCQRYPFFG